MGISEGATVRSAVRAAINRERRNEGTKNEKEEGRRAEMDRKSGVNTQPTNLDWVRSGVWDDAANERNKTGPARRKQCKCN